MAGSTQFILYALAAVPIPVMFLSAGFFRDAMLIMLVDLVLLVILSKVAGIVAPKDTNFLPAGKSDYEPFGGEHTHNSLKEKKSTYLPLLLTFVICLGAYILLWIAGLSNETVFYTMMPVFDSATYKWLYWVLFFFVFSTVYPAIEGTFYYMHILGSLQGNVVQAIIVGVLAWAKSITVITYTVNKEGLPETWLWILWLVLNLLFAYFAYTHRSSIGTISRQLSYILILVGWVLLFNNPFSLNRKPDRMALEPKDIFSR